MYKNNKIHQFYSRLDTLPSNVSILSHPSSKLNLQNHAISPQPLYAEILYQLFIAKRGTV